MTANKLETIDLTPTWSGLVPLMCAVLENPDADYAAKKDIRDEIARMAKAVDKFNADNKAKREGGETE
jgi:hypothetical protein